MLFPTSFKLDLGFFSTSFTCHCVLSTKHISWLQEIVLTASFWSLEVVGKRKGMELFCHSYMVIVAQWYLCWTCGWVAVSLGNEYVCFPLDKSRSAGTGSCSSFIKEQTTLMSAHRRGIEESRDLAYSRFNCYFSVVASWPVWMPCLKTYNNHHLYIRAVWC